MLRRAALPLLAVLVVLAAAAAIFVLREAPEDEEEVEVERGDVLARGVNISRWSPDDEGRDSLPGERLDYLVDRGVTYLRIPVDPDHLLEDGDLTRPDEDGERALAATVARATERGLGVSVTLRTGAEQTRSWTDDPDTVEELGEYWERLAGVLESAAEDPDELLFLAPMNEPLTDPETWEPVQRDLLGDIRRGAPEATLIATTSPWSYPGEVLTELEPLPDPDVVYAVHLYVPEPFIYQQVHFRPEQAWLMELEGLPYPVRQPACDEAAERVSDPVGRTAAEDYCDAEWGPADIQAEVSTIADWGLMNDRRVIVEEFGVWQGAPDEDRLRLLTDLREAMERRDLGWAVWAYDDAFGLGSDDSQEVWEALGLDPAPPYDNT